MAIVKKKQIFFKILIFHFFMLNSLGEIAKSGEFQKNIIFLLEEMINTDVI